MGTSPESTEGLISGFFKISTRAERVEKIVNQIQSEEIKQFILSRLNKESNNAKTDFFGSLFREEPIEKVDIPSTIQSEYENFNPIALFAACATQEDTDTLILECLKLEDDELVSLLKGNSPECCYRVETLLKYLSDAAKKQLISRLKNLKTEQLDELFFIKKESFLGGRYKDYDYHLYQGLLQTEDDELMQEGIALFSQLSNKKKYSLLKTSKHSEFGLMRLMAKPLSNQSALALLKALGTMEPSLLKKLFKGEDESYSYTKETLMNAVLLNYSQDVIEQAFSLLSQLDTSFIKESLTQEAKSYHASYGKHRRVSKSFSLKANPQSSLVSGEPSPQSLTDSANIITHLAMNRTDCPAVGMSLIKTIALNSELKSLVIDKAFGLSILELAVKTNNQRVLNWFFEQADYQLQLNEKKKNKLLSLAKECKQEQAQAIIEGAPVYQALTYPNQNNKKPFDYIDAIERNPEIVNGRWSQDRTLLHIAAARGNLKAVNVLIESGANVNALDKEGLTPWQHAIFYNHTDVALVLLKNHDTKLHLPNANGETVLTQALKQHDYTVTRAIISELQSSLDPSNKREIFTSALAKLPLRDVPFQQINTLMENTDTSKSLQDCLEDYCDSQNDERSCFLIEIARYYSTINNSSVAFTCKNHLKNQLKALAEAGGNLNKAWVRQELVLFLFAMSPEKITQLIDSLELTDNEQAQLELILCQGLVKSAIYTRLTVNEQKSLLSFFIPNSPAFQTLVDIHFRQSELTELPPVLLKDLAKNLPLEKLIAYSKNRLHPMLTALTLSQTYQKTPNDVEALNELQEALEKELDLLNKPANKKTLSQLAGLCNLVDSPAVKAFFMNYLSTKTHDAPIYRNLALLFEEFTPQKPLNQESLLYSLFLDSCLQQSFDGKDAHFKGVKAFLQVAKKEDVEQVLEASHTKLLSSIQTERLLASATTGDSEIPTNHAMPQWLFGLHAANARIELTEIISHLFRGVELCENVLEELGNNNAFDAHLKTFSKALTELADELITQQFNRDYPSHSSSIEEKLQQVRLLYPLLKETFEQHQARLSESKPLALQQLNQLLELSKTQSISRLINEAFLKSNTQKQAQSRNLHQAASLSKAHQQQIKTIFSPENTPLDETQLHELADSYQQTLQDYTLKLTDSLKSAIESRGDSATLLPGFYRWQISNGTYALPTKLTFSVPVSLNTLPEQAIQEIQQDLKARYKTIKSSAALLPKLKSTNIQSLSLNALIDALHKESIDDLKCLKALCDEAQCSDLALLLNYVIKGKQANWDSYTLQDLSANLKITHINQWLLKCHATLVNYSATVSSMKVLYATSYQKDADNITRLKSLIKAITKPQVSQSFTPQAFEVLVNSYKESVMVDMYSPLSQQFIFALYLLLDKTSTSQQVAFVNTLPVDLLEKLIAYCLSSVGADDPSRVIACKGLLSKLCQHAKEGKEARLSAIKKHLNQQDLSLLGSKELQELAVSVLNEKDSLSECVYDGVWIQRLLSSPRFIAQCSSQDITRLVERYKALSLTLKQDEFERLNQFIAGKLKFAKEHRKGMISLQKEILANPEQKERLTAKRERLLQFRATDSVRALFTQLEDNCIALKKTYPEAGEQALEVIYTYHSEQLSGMRSDLLFKMANFIVGKAQGKKGDIAKANSRLSQWLEEHLPHHNFHQAELEKKTDVFLYDEAGQKIGFLDESNYAMGFVHDYPVSLLEKGYKPETPVYDKNRCRIGTLLENGQCKRDNLFQRKTSALLVGKVPTEQLMQSEAALDLLLQDVLSENTLDLLYENSSSAEKLEWLKGKIAERVQNSHQIISEESIERIIVHNDFTSVMTMMANCSNKQNAQRVFKAILSNEAMRNTWLEGQHQELFFAFLNQQKARKVFADLLIDNTTKPWFNQSLRLFANYSIQHKKPHLLSKTLTEIAAKVENKEITLSRYDMVMDALIGTKESAKILLSGFLQDDGAGTVQSKSSLEMRQLARFFDKTHLTEAVSCINEDNNWKDNAQYRLLLRILQTEQSRLFPRTELRLSERYAWQAKELDELTAFVTRHLESQNKQDKDNEIGQRLLSEIVFRCANFGITKLFYTKDNQLNPKMAGDSIKRGFIESISSRLYLVKAAKKAIKRAYNSVKDWFNSEPEDNKALIKELKDNYAIIDWKSLAKRAWSHTDSTKMPLIVAYLMNYAGPKETLETLLRDIIMHPEFTNDPHYLGHISYVMAKFYHRDVSHVIFSVFESIAAQKPSIMTPAILTNMATFHALANSQFKRTHGVMRDEIDLVRHFGQQKHYALTHHCCQLLANKYEGQALGKQIKRASTEAKIEHVLQKNVGKWFFGISQFFKRWWNYGNKGRKNPTGLVKFCDDKEEYTSPVSPPELVRTHVLSGQYVSKQIDLTKRRRLLKEKFQAFMQKHGEKKELQQPIHQVADFQKLCLFGEVKDDFLGSPASNQQAIVVN